jgi:hypothetical protein
MPPPPDRTVEMMMMSFSRPWNPSTVLDQQVWHKLITACTADNTHILDFNMLDQIRELGRDHVIDQAKLGTVGRDNTHFSKHIFLALSKRNWKHSRLDVTLRTHGCCGTGKKPTLIELTLSATLMMCSTSASTNSACFERKPRIPSSQEASHAKGATNTPPPHCVVMLWRSGQSHPSSLLKQSCSQSQPLLARVQAPVPPLCW